MLPITRWVGLLLLVNPVISADPQRALLEPRVAGITAGIDSLDRVRSLYGNGTETVLQDVRSLCYYLEQDRAYLSVSSFEHENRIRNITLTTFANVAPNCRATSINGKHLTAFGGIGLGDSTTRVSSILGPPSGSGKVHMGDHEMLHADYTLARGQLTCLYEEAKLVLLAVETPAGRDPNGDGSSVVAFAEGAAVRAINFRQGDAAGFARSRSDFSQSGWEDFMKVMQPFLDEKGAPIFNSIFVASGRAKVLDEKNGMVRIRIPGALTQSNKLGKTTYSRAALEVLAGGDPVKLEKVQQITCVGASTACQ